MAALYVLVHHVWTISHDTGLDVAAAPAFTRAAFLFSFGHFAVDLFIVLSGYSLMLGVLKKQAAPKFSVFLKRRAFRILPPYYAVLAVPLLLHGAALLTGHAFLSAEASTPRSIWFHLLLIQDTAFDTATHINAPLWSVSVEWRIYLLFPLFSALFLKRGLRALLLASLAAFGIALGMCEILHLSQAYSITGISPQYLVLFAFGMTAAVLRYSDAPKYARVQNRLTKLPWRPMALALVAAGGAFLYAAEPWSTSESALLFVYDGVAGLVAVLLLLSGSFATPSAVVNRPRLARIGLMAYSLYLVHFPVLQAVARLLKRFPPGDVSLGLFYLLGPLCALVVAFVFYRLVEYPCIPRQKTA